MFLEVILSSGPTSSDCPKGKASERGSDRDLDVDLLNRQEWKRSRNQKGFIGREESPNKTLILEPVLSMLPLEDQIRNPSFREELDRTGEYLGLCALSINLQQIDVV